MQCIEIEAKERRLWLLVAFLLRSNTVPEIEYENINANEIEHAREEFYSLFEKLFTAKNCTYSVHVFGSHIPQIRSQGPLTETSAFPFENFYGEMRRSFTPGTVSTVKQIMERVYLKRTVSYHCCQKSIYYSHKDTPLEMNSIIYEYVDGIYNMYVITEIDKDNPDIFYCNVQGKIEIDFQEATDLNWSTVGVFKEGATGDDIIEVNRKNVHGKVLKICSLLITCPKNILQEN